jgi:hypothetical protein
MFLFILSNKKKKLVGSNFSCVLIFIGYVLTLTIGCVSALIDHETNTPINRKVLFSVKIKLVFFL